MSQENQFKMPPPITPKAKKVINCENSGIISSQVLTSKPRRAFEENTNSIQSQSNLINMTLGLNQQKVKYS